MSLTKPAATTEFTRDENGHWTGTVEPWGARAYVIGNIPANGSTYSSAFGAGDPWASTTLRIARFTESANAARGILRLTYSNVPAVSGGEANPKKEKPDDTPVYSIRESGLEMPIEKVAGYKPYWNHHLLTVEGEAVWAGWSNPAGPEVEDAAAREHNRVIRYDQGFERVDGEGRTWRISSAATKPGVDAKIISGPMVTERRWFSQLSDAVTFMSSHRRGTKATPGQTFGVTGGEWLIMDSNLDPDGQRWEAQVFYQWADEWDAELYGA